MSIVDAVVRSDMTTIELSTKGRCRPTLILEVVVRKDPRFLDITENNALDRTQWRQWIHAAHPN